MFSTEKCLSDPSEKPTGRTLSDGAVLPPSNLPKFTIRDYVFNSRAENLESYWPFSKRSLQICLKHGVKDVLPPYQSLDSLRKKTRTVMEDVKKLSELRINGGREDDGDRDESRFESADKTESGSSKVCPVCKAFSSSSNTTLNAHIDQCLVAEPAAESAAKSSKHRNDRMERRKVRLMVDVYAAARRCTLEDLDRRNGTKWSGERASDDDDNGGFKERAPQTRGGDDERGAVYFDSNGTKLRILSKFDDGIVGREDDKGKKSRSSSRKKEKLPQCPIRRSALFSTASRRRKESEEEEEYRDIDNDERENVAPYYSEARSGKRLRRKTTTADKNRECSSSSSHEEYVVVEPKKHCASKKKMPRPESKKRAASARTSWNAAVWSKRGPPDDDDDDAFFSRVVSRSRKRTDHARHWKLDAADEMEKSAVDGAMDSDVRGGAAERRRIVDFPVEEPPRHGGLLFSGLSSQDSSLFFNEFGEMPTAAVEEIAIPGPPGSFLPSPGRGGNSFVSCCEDGDDGGDGFGNGCDSSLLGYDPEAGITDRGSSGCGRAAGGGGGVLRLMGKDLMVAPSMQTGGSLRLQRHRPSLVTAAMVTDACGMHGME